MCRRTPSLKGKVTTSRSSSELGASQALKSPCACVRGMHGLCAYMCPRGCEGLGQRRSPVSCLIILYLILEMEKDLLFKQELNKPQLLSYKVLGAWLNGRVLA